MIRTSRRSLVLPLLFGALACGDSDAGTDAGTDPSSASTSASDASAGPTGATESNTSATEASTSAGPTTDDGTSAPGTTSDDTTEPGTTTGEPSGQLCDGFSSSSKSWSLPSPNVPNGADLFDDPFYDLYLACEDDAVELSFSLIDLTGDGAVDLVITDACDAKGVGTTEWRVYENTGAGFASNSKSWSLPAPNVPNGDDLFDDPYYDLYLACNDDAVELSFSLMDLTGQGVPSLVITDACDAQGVGTTEWRVYEPTCEPI